MAYEYKEYPKMVKDLSGQRIIVNSREEEENRTLNRKKVEPKSESQVEKPQSLAEVAKTAKKSRKKKAEEGEDIGE